MIVPRFVLGGRDCTAPSDQLVVTGVGMGGKGESDLAAFAKTGKVRIGYLCDVDERRAARAVQAFPPARYCKDWRQLLDKEGKNFDAVSVATADHNHAVITLAAMQTGKHVYVQNPLNQNFYEARALTEAAKRYKVVTQMGNQGASGNGILFIGQKDKMMASTYSADPRLLPLSRNQEVRVKPPWPACLMGPTATTPNGSKPAWLAMATRPSARPSSWPARSPKPCSWPTSPFAATIFSAPKLPARASTIPAAASSCSGTRSRCASPISRRPTSL